MYMLHLFDADPDAGGAIEPIEARLLTDGRLRIGRDRAADWPIADPDQAISRAHLELNCGPEGLELVSVGANGVFDRATGQRFPDRVAVPVAVPSSFRLGRFHIRATKADGRPPRERARPFASGSLLDAFCEGAGLDASRLAAEDPAAVMRRAGAVYREMVGGMGELVAAREKAREGHQFTRTTIAGIGNNPFKWGPAQRLAIDLLLDRGEGFLSGPVALRASIADVLRHLRASEGGYRAVIRWTVARFAPAALADATEGQATLMRSRATLQLAEAAQRHAELDREVDGEPGGLIDRAFVAGYEAADR